MSCELNYTITTDVAWLSCTPSSGVAAGRTPIRVDYDTDALAAGTYSANITVTDANAGNSPETIPVTLWITEVPTGADSIGRPRKHRFVRTRVGPIFPREGLKE